MGRRDDDDRERAQEARRILKQIREETDPQTGTHVQSWLLRPKAFFNASDANPHDRIEVIGLRVGRLLGLVGFAVFAIIVFFQLTT
ncbi:hypothetical protein U0C82_07575 [Fulvimarina sp. 2208YS6-2-32]|uniref:Uncharacterized protein n=1 Tax=Fulvimarina uroteuthidis TaxID=3098149 RepID=A0ABU5I1A5_9HYPH|nr:hypothetical protein [Fulvimarina sp. 2208YS6-2-32]MDY8109001.1 hypothetical protein [Fulvimarina sp. 2208YS6-2-32]